MKLAMPTIEEERMALARSRAGLSGRDASWRSSRLIPRVIFFVLTLICVSAAAGLLSIMGLPVELFSAVAAIAVAELLISGKRLFHAGPEEALWLAGTVGLIFALPGSPSSEAAILLAVAFAAAGTRVRNPLFLAVAVGLAAVYLSMKIGRSEPASFLALAIAFAALALSNREWRDPLIEHLLAFLVVGMPLLAYGFSVFDEWRHVNSGARIGIAAAVAAAFLLVGALRRYRPAILGGAACALIAGYLIDRRLLWPGATRFVFWGLILLVLTIAVVVVLRNRTRGMTSEKLEEIEGFALAEVAAATVSVPRPAAPAPAIGGGGSFGGGGASGEY